MIKSNIRLQSYASHGRYLYATGLLIKEILLIFFYILFAFLYSWLGLANNDHLKTCRNVSRWLVESSLTPHLVGGFLIEYFIGPTNLIFDEYQTYSIIGIVVKVPLFFMMRYAESQPDFFVNHFELCLIIKLCKLVSK